MEYFWPHYEYQSTTSTLSSTGDKMTFSRPNAVEIRRLIGIVTTTFSGQPLVVVIDKRPTIGSDTSRGDGDILAAKSITANLAAGKGFYIELATPYRLKPGEEAVVEVTTALGSAGAAKLAIEYQPLSFQGASPDYVNLTKY